ncbi:MAG: VWA domain-containing protein [Gemmataceae bacterium]|nr:VWA domain-containing protein [Gemmataceae bacterium]
MAHPEALFLLLLLPLLVWRHLRQRRASVLHPDLRLFDGLPVPSSWAARHGALSLRLLALVLLVLALAGPRWPDLRTRLDTHGIAVLLALDASGSMDQGDSVLDGQAVSRLEAAKLAFAEFVRGRPADLIGYLRFATRPRMACPPTLQHETLLGLLKEEKALTGPDESETNISDALVLGLSRLRSAPPARKVLVLLTDGEQTVQAPRSAFTPGQAAHLAKSLGVVVHAIDAGPAQPAPGQEAARLLGVETLKEIASATGGHYLAATDAASLREAVRRLDRHERSLIESFQYRRYHEAYPWLALASLLCFGLAEALSRTLWRRLP